MKSFKGKVAFITGTASGIGEELAIQLAAEGAKIAAIDYNKDGLSSTCETIKAAGGTVKSYLVDVSKKEQVYDTVEAVIKDFGHVDIVINNAGVALGAISMEDVSYEEIDWIFGINLMGVIYGSKAFISHLKTRPEAALVNVSSVFGLAGFLHQGPYCMTKFAVRGMTETLRAEMIGTNVLVMQVHPGGIKTKIAENARHRTKDEEELKEFKANFETNARTTSKEAAKVIIKGIRNKNPRVRIGMDAKIIDWLARFLPIRSNKIFAKILEKGGL